MVARDAIEADIRAWMTDFITVPNSFYHGRFPPCPYAQHAIATAAVDLAIWQSGDVRTFIRDHAAALPDSPKLTTRVLVFPPRTQFVWGLGDFIETLNADLVDSDVFLNTGIAKTTASRYPGQPPSPYFIVVANRLAAVLKGAEALQRTGYYTDWPQEHYDLVVLRRARLARRRAAKS